MPCYFRLRTVVLAAWIGVFATGPALAVTWDMYIYNAVASIPSVRDTQKMIDRIDAETNHALQIRLHLGGSLQINVTTITQAVGDGIVQMADDSFFAGSIPIGDLSRLPFLVSSQDEYGKIEPIVSRYMEAGYAKRGIVMLGAYVYPVQVAFARKKLTSLADMKGLKMRVTSPEQGEFVKRFGGIPITMGTPEVPAALDRGVIDGAFTASAGAGYPWKDLLKYNYRRRPSMRCPRTSSRSSAGSLPRACQATFPTCRPRKPNSPKKWRTVASWSPRLPRKTSWKQPGAWPVSGTTGHMRMARTA